MNKNRSLRQLSRRRVVVAGAGLAALVPAYVLAEGGLKGGNTDDTDSAPDDALAGIGVTGDGSYESPIFGYQVTWDTNWIIPTDDPGSSSPADRWDILRLYWADMADPDDPGVMLSFDGFDGPGMDIQDWLEGMTDPDTLDGFFGQGVYASRVALVAQDGDVQEVVWRLIGIDDPDDIVTMISSYRTMADDMMLMTTLSVFNHPVLSDALSGMIDGVSINDEPVLSLLTLAEIEDALAELD